jgi:squalene-hopene/tetraprenyl-beta-curcumene cyclase
MTNRKLWAFLLLIGCFVAVCVWRIPPVRGASEPSSVNWNRKTAAGYLDSREVWWQDWPRAKKDHGTICISCHTVVPYAMARPGLRKALSETEETSEEKILMDNVETRVSRWSEMVPFYSDVADGKGKTAESHSTEAVLNAVTLTSYDARRGNLRPITRTALDAAWTLQVQTGENAGGWIWQDFHLAPWESADSAYQGAALLMVEAGDAPGGYASELGVREHVGQLRGYLRRQYAAQPLINQAYILWASAKAPGLLTGAEQKALRDRLVGLQQADGGWRTSSLVAWKRLDDTAQPAASDGYATALVVLAIEESGTGRQDDTLKRGVQWLEQHQEKNGAWKAASLNKKRDPESNVGRFMDDAATGYAVLALEHAR